jgi:hypothetical protein
MAAAVELTLAEAATLLEPAITEQQLRAIIRALGWQPSGWRHRGSGRAHPVACYDAARILALHGALTPFMRTRQAQDVCAGS